MRDGHHDLRRACTSVLNIAEVIGAIRPIRQTRHRQRKGKAVAMDSFMVVFQPIAMLAICVSIAFIVLYFVVRRAVRDGIADAMKMKGV